jgi:hypothetical protein
MGANTPHGGKRIVLKPGRTRGGKKVRPMPRGKRKGKRK